MSYPFIPGYKVSEVLSGALKTLQAHGWIQGSYGDTESGLCSLGAIDAQYPPHDVLMDAYRMFSDVVGEPVIARWNDAEGRTFEQVESAFRRAIRFAEDFE